MKFHEETIDFFVDMEEANGWSHTSYRILQYLLADQIDRIFGWSDASVFHRLALVFHRLALK